MAPTSFREPFLTLDCPSGDSRIARMVVRSFKQTPANVPNTEGLSARELEILTLLSKGLSNKEIAGSLDLSDGTIRSHLDRIFKKLHVHCRSEAVAKYLRAQSSPRV